MVSCIRAICDNRLHVCPHLCGDELKLFWFYQNRRQASFVSEKCRSKKITVPITTGSEKIQRKLPNLKKKKKKRKKECKIYTK